MIAGESVTFGDSWERRHDRHHAPEHAQRSAPDARRICQHPDAAECGCGRVRPAAHRKPSMISMIAMSIMYPDLPKQQALLSSVSAVAQDSRRAGLAPEQHVSANTPFQPLDPGILDASIP